MKVKKLFFVAGILTMLMSMTVFANDFTWENLPGNHNQSVLLNEGEVTSQDIVRRNARGEILSTGITEITNKQNGELRVRISTYAHNSVDRIHHAVYLDQWSDAKQDWIQIDSWEFEKTKEEANGKLTSFSTDFTLSGYEVNKYYRLRGIHVVELGNEMEGCATETDGVKLTKR